VTATQENSTMRFGSRLLSAATLALALTAGSVAQAASPEADLATAENAYAALDYPSALSAADSVLAKGSLSHDVLTRATRVAALAHAALGHADQAKQQFVLLLEYDPEFKVDAKLGPRFTEPFAEAKGYWQAQGRRPGMDVQVVVQYGQPGEIRVTTRDPLGIVKRVSSGHRWAPRREFTASDGDAARSVEVEANPSGSTRLEYYVRAIDAKGNAVFEEGTPELPRSTVVTEPSRGGGAGEEKKSFFSSPAFLIIGGALVAGAAVGGYFAFRPTEYTPAGTGRGVLGATCGNARCE